MLFGVKLKTSSISLVNLVEFSITRKPRPHERKALVSGQTVNHRCLGARLGGETWEGFKQQACGVGTEILPAGEGDYSGCWRI